MGCCHNCEGGLPRIPKLHQSEKNSGTREQQEQMLNHSKVQNAPILNLFKNSLYMSRVKWAKLEDCDRMTSTDSPCNNITCPEFGVNYTATALWFLIKNRIPSSSIVVNNPYQTSFPYVSDPDLTKFLIVESQEFVKMAEAEIASLTPRVHVHISHIPAPDWTAIHQDLAALNWLQPHFAHVTPLCSSVLHILDSCATADLKGERKFNVLKLNEIRLFLNTVFEAFATMKSEMKDANSGFKTEVQDFGFLKTGGKWLVDRSDEDLGTEVIRVSSIYEDLRETAQCITFHLEPSFYLEQNRKIEDFLDEQYWKKVLEPIKHRLRDTEPIAALLKIYARNYSVSFGTRPRNFLSQVWGGNYNKETIFFGELNPEGLKQGFGRITYANGDEYEGYWVNDRQEGQGVFQWKDSGKYEGEFLAGKMHGRGRRVYRSGNVYTGEFVEGRKQGLGVMQYKNGDLYDGEWLDDFMHGRGTYTWAQGCIFTGSFIKDRREGKGTLSLSPDDVHDAEWINGKMRAG